MRLVLIMVPVLIALLPLSPSVADPRQLSDINCPAAVPALRAVRDLKDPNDSISASRTIEEVALAYRYCYYRAFADGALEPSAHYSETRLAQFDILLGREYMKQQRWDDAHEVFAEALSLSTNVAEWRAPTFGYIARPGRAMILIKNRGAYNNSQFAQAAREVQGAANSELARLEPVPPPSRRQTPATPMPSAEPSSPQ